MPVRQITKTCWVASWPGDTRTDEQANQGVHYATGEHESLNGAGWFHLGCGGLVTADRLCLLCETSDLGIFDEPRTVKHRAGAAIPRPLLGCWEVTCDTCELELEDDEQGFVHFASFDQAAGYAAIGGWPVYADGRAYCEPDAPPAGSGSRLTVPDPGQPFLFAAGEAQ